MRNISYWIYDFERYFFGDIYPWRLNDLYRTVLGIAGIRAGTLFQLPSRSFTSRHVYDASGLD